MTLPISKIIIVLSNNLFTTVIKYEPMEWEVNLLDKSELLDEISKIIFAIPDEIYKYSEPDSCFSNEWTESSPMEKAYLLIEDLLINFNKEKKIERQNLSIDIKDMRLGKSPTFYSGADENMFFNAIYTMPSYVQIKGQGMDLYLHYSYPMTIEEKDFLKGLLKRYSMDIPNEIKWMIVRFFSIRWTLVRYYEYL